MMIIKKKEKFKEMLIYAGLQTIVIVQYNNQEIKFKVS